MKMNKKEIKKSLLIKSFIFIFILTGLFLSIQFVSSNTLNSNFDSITYSNNDLTVDFITNGQSQGQAILKSHKSVNEIVHYGLGEQVVMSYEFNMKNPNQNVINDPIFINKRTGKEIQRLYSFVYWGEKTIQQNVSTLITPANNQTNESAVYSYSLENYTYFDWLPYNIRDLPNGKILIGLKTNVQAGDFIDGIWSISNKKIKKHAVWTADLNTNLISYYKLDESSGTTAIDSFGNNNGTTTGATVNVAGKINKSYSFDGVGDEVDTGIDTEANFNQDKTINVWYKSTATDIRIIVGKFSGSGDDYWLGVIAGGGFRFSFDPVGSISYTGGNSNDGNWHMATAVVNTNGNYEFYFDGSYVGGFAYSSISPSGNLILGAFGTGGSTTYDFNGKIDEVGIWNRSLTSTEVAQLYNSGIGISLTIDSSPILTTQTPTDLTYNSVTLNGNLTDLGTENGGNVFFQYIRTSDI